MPDLSPRFNFKDVEDKWCRFWEEKNLFHAAVDPNKKPYTVVIPPPNVTGILHMGHALNNTLQDIIIRYKRMNGFETLWMPGTDHAGIATQNVVEKQLAQEGKNRNDLGREKFIVRSWEFRERSGDTILYQLRKLGASCDWQRTQFTLDEHYSEAVKYTFVKLYEKGLIYRGEYIINWCPRCLTALSDEEAEHKETQGNLYHIRYPLKDYPVKYLIVATTRPETMLGDTAVAVHPEDKRYKDFVGKTVILPLIKREIPVIADEFVDPTFGTGAVKVTPAHDPNDFQMGKRHDLPFINIMHPDGRINEKGGRFNNLARFEARKAIIEDLKQQNLLEKIEPHMHSIGHCYRCHTVVEPYLSKQWFVKMKPLAQPAIAAVKDGSIKFYPDRWVKVYLNWMENIRDWCISRQIWWGHRIPVWYCPKCKEGENIIVSMDTPKGCPKCHTKELIQDEDVLDTWFSSWLWPFATLGWTGVTLDEGRKTSDARVLTSHIPRPTSHVSREEIKYFYPTASLFTAPEIIFFWVARMIMAGFEFMGDKPFSDVYIHGTVRDAKGRKMSKSLGNAIDPLEIINEYGADALRFSLIINSGQDIFISKEKFEIGRNFANKIWNASRLILMNTDQSNLEADLNVIAQQKNLDLSSRWIISRFYSTLEKVNAAIEKYRFSEAESLLYDFVRGDFCDWYLEIIKDRWSDKTTRDLAVCLLKMSLKMLHPFMPFVTEEIWSHIHLVKGALCIQPWPNFEKNLVNEKAEKDIRHIINITTGLRNVRSFWNIMPLEKITCIMTTKSPEEFSLLKDTHNLIKHMARTKDIKIEKETLTFQNAAIFVVKNTTVSVWLGGIDINKEKQRVFKQIQEKEKAKESLDQRLKNENFVQKAPHEVIEKEKERRKELEIEIQELKNAVANLS